MYIPSPVARLGEEIASKFLTKKGYKIIDRNFRKGYGEIDIIAVYNNVLVFIEVKTRTTNLYGGAIEAINYGKIRTLIKTCEYYKMLYPKLPESLRIDAILIDLENNEAKSIQHIQNISEQ
jgi:putative endonuclease